MKMVLASVFAVGLLSAVVPTAAGAANAGIGFTAPAVSHHDANFVDARWHGRHRARYCRSWGWHHRCRGWGWRWY